MKGGFIPNIFDESLEGTSLQGMDHISHQTGSSENHRLKSAILGGDMLVPWKFNRQKAPENRPFPKGKDR